jgi:L-lactate permease
LTYLIRIAFFRTSLPLAHAAILNGLLQALTPISTVFGANFFFVALERSGAMETLTLWLDGISRNRVAQLIIVGWSFIFLIEGASGFGTPAALAAPILVGLGFPPLRVAVLCIVMNAVPTSFGAVGTPTWFGLGSLGLTQAQLLEIGLKTALMHSVAALVIPVIALRFVLDWKEIRSNLLFVELAVLASVLPMICVATIALFGALIFVQLLTIDGSRASTLILGDALAYWTGNLWVYFAGFLGALGSFFSGSNTISNLTFGPIQLRIAQDLGLASTTMLSLQTVGAAMGNMVAIHNIVAVCAVLGLKDQEGAILQKTFIPTLVYGIILAILAGLWLAIAPAA